MARDGVPIALHVLTSVVAFDRSVISEPARVRAALLDMTDDHAGVELLVLSARLGVPDLVAAGNEDAARAVLVNSIGLRLELAAAVVAGWRDALGAGTGDTAGSTGAEVFRDIRSAAPAGALGALGPVDCHAWADGAVSVLVLGMDGLALATVDTPVRGGPATWHPIAVPRAPVSRAACIAPLAASTAMVVWTDDSGVWGRPVHRPGPGGVVEIGEPRLIDSPEAGQPRYPIAALGVDGREMDVLWTVDRRHLIVSTRDGLGATEQRAIPSPCAGPERVVGLDCAPASDRTAWLAALTDRGRLQLARWDVPGGEHDGWRPVAGPAAGAASMTVVTLSAGTSLIVGYPSGVITATDAASAYSGQAGWHQVELPAGTGGLAGLNGLAAGAHGDLAWAVATTPGTMRLLRLQRYAETPEVLESLALS